MLLQATIKFREREMLINNVYPSEITLKKTMEMSFSFNNSIPELSEAQ